MNYDSEVKDGIKVFCWGFIIIFIIMVLTMDGHYPNSGSSSSYDTRSWKQQSQDEALDQAREDSQMMIK